MCPLRATALSTSRREKLVADDNRWDLHLHSSYSWDTAPGLDVTSVCAAAVRGGLRGLALTDHFDSVPDQGLANRRPTGVLDIARRSADIDAAREEYPDLTVLTGLEYGEPHLNPAQIKAVREEFPLDVVLGSVHAIVVGNELLPVEDVIARDPIDATMRSYLQQVLTMVEESPVDVLAHIEYPLRHGNIERYRPEMHTDLYTQIFSTAAARGISVEYNTKSNAPLLDQLWPIIDELDATTLTIGSDAHTAERIGHGVVEASRVLRRRGFGDCQHLPGRHCRHRNCHAAPPSRVAIRAL